MAHLHTNTFTHSVTEMLHHTCNAHAHTSGTTQHTMSEQNTHTRARSRAHTQANSDPKLDRAALGVELETLQAQREAMDARMAQVGPGEEREWGRVNRARNGTQRRAVAVRDNEGTGGCVAGIRGTCNPYWSKRWNRLTDSGSLRRITRWRECKGGRKGGRV